MLSMPANRIAIPDRPILVVDDDAKIVRLVRTYLERDGFMVVTAADGPAALDAIERHRPALVVLDLMLPELDGRRRHPGGPPRRRGRRDADPHPVGARLGHRSHRGPRGRRRRLPAKAVLPGRARARASSRSCAGRVPGGSDRSGQAPLRLADLVVDLDRYEVTRDGMAIPLTRVEFKLLATLIEAGGRVLTRDQLLDAVWGQDQADVLDRTVDVHVGRLRDRLGDDADAPRYVVTVRGIGYRAATPMIGRGIATRIALAALASAAVGVAIVAIGITVVGGEVFRSLMVEAGDSAEHAQAMYDQSVTTVVVAARDRGGRRERGPRDRPRADARPADRGGGRRGEARRGG
jgi:DNA-binding response OmpR family regulator